LLGMSERMSQWGGLPGSQLQNIQQIDAAYANKRRCTWV
jgi:hypothetical protein